MLQLTSALRKEPSLVLPMGLSWQLAQLSEAMCTACKLYQSPVTSILLYGSETWTLLADSQERIQAFETKCMKKLLCIFNLMHKTNDWVWSKINLFVGPQEPLLATVKRWKLAFLRYVTCHDSLSKTILQGTMESGQCQSWQRKRWMDKIKEWTLLPMPELLMRASCRKDWKRISAESSLMSP